MPSKSPTRFVSSPAVRARFGERVDRLGPRLYDGDPLADAAVRAMRSLAHSERTAMVDRALRGGEGPVVDELRALVGACERLPFWVDFDRVNRGGNAFLRSGILGGLVLGTYALTASYCSPAGNKPLVLSGRLEEETPRRLAETSRYVQLVSQRDALRPGQEGWISTVKVRLMHASVRAMALASPKWKLDEWGIPINQVDSAGTGLLFSWVVLDGLDKLGFGIEGDEREDLLHLWRYASFVLGVDDDLLWATEREAKHLWELLASTQEPPDEDSRRLARSLLESGRKAARNDIERARAERMVPVSYALSRYFIGDEMADALGMPRTGIERALPLLRHVRSGAKLLARGLGARPIGTADAGARYWQFVVEQGLRGTPADFSMPAALRSA